jgi:6-phosphogluconolactonase
MPYHVYVSVSGEGRIAKFTMEKESGALTPGADIPLPGEPAYAAVHPIRNWMYVARKEEYCFTAFDIEPDTGELTEIATTPSDANPAYVAVDRTGKYLLSASYYSAATSVYPIADNGAVVEKPVEYLNTGIGAHCIHTDPSNRFVFVPHIDNRGGPNTILQFCFDDTTGRLTPNDPPRVPQEKGVGPRHFCFHPAKDIVYVSNEQGSSISVYAFDSVKGTLAPLQTLSNLPKDWEGKNTCAQIRVTPDGRFLYAPNRGHNSLAEYLIDPNSGLLTALGHASAEKIPRAFQIDPAGKFLLSAGHESGRLASYRINQETGRLEPMDILPLGAVPMWISILDLG